MSYSLTEKAPQPGSCIYLKSFGNQVTLVLGYVLSLGNHLKEGYCVSATVSLLDRSRFNGFQLNLTE